VKERLDDRPRLVRPIRVGALIELLTRSLVHEVSEPGIQRTFARQLFERPNDSLGLVLKTVNLEALMVEAVDRIFETPVARTAIEECCQPD